MEWNRKKSNIVIVTSGSYPYGAAATNRHLSLSRGLIELGCVVHLLCIIPAKNQDKKSNKIVTNYKGIDIEYTCQTTKWSKNSLKKTLIMFKGIVNSFNTLKKINNNYNIDVAIILVANPIIIEIYVNWFKKRKIKIIHERTEYPFVNIKNTVFSKKILLPIYLKYTINKFDGIYVINKELLNYFKKILRKPVKLETILMTVEPDRFNLSKKYLGDKDDYIAYCGSMYNDKDGVPILIDAFKIIAEKYPNLKLYLIGDISDKKKIMHIYDKVKKLCLEKRIIFTGKISRDEIPNLLCNARVLALARPDNIQAKGGFPTKLGEYLATGNPVVVTRVGEITVYLNNNVNAYLAEPNNPIDFSKKLDEALQNVKTARKIGHHGKNLAFKVFNYKVQAKKLIDFIESI